MITFKKFNESNIESKLRRLCNELYPKRSIARPLFIEAWKQVFGKWNENSAKWVSAKDSPHLPYYEFIATDDQYNKLKSALVKLSKDRGMDGCPWTESYWPDKKVPEGNWDIDFVERGGKTNAYQFNQDRQEYELAE